MSPQLILRIVGIAALVVSALFALLAVQYFFSKDIRGVMDDLSGKARVRGVAGVRKRSSEKGASSGARAARASAPAASVRQGAVEQVSQPAHDVFAAASAFEEEDEVGTVLVAATSADAGYPVPVSEDDLATMVEAGESGEPTASSVSKGTMGAGSTDAPDASLFHITRRLVMIHSQEIIAEREGQMP